MKKSELQKIIKEELLTELNMQTFQKMNGLVNVSYLKHYDRSIHDIFNDLQQEGFEHPEIEAFLQQRVVRLLKIISSKKSYKH